MADEEEASIELGGNIKLTGFRDVEPASMIIVKKMVGTYVRKLGELCKNIQEVHLTLKRVHEREMSEKYELHVSLLDNGRLYNADNQDRAGMNLFVELDKVLASIQNAVSKNCDK